MSNPLKNIKNEAAKLALSPLEKSAMKARVFGMPTPAAMSPSTSPYFFFSYQFIHARILAPAMVLLVVFVGAGTAAAAQGALPGDVLYPVKLSVNETIQVALATTPVAKAQVQASLAQRRVEEAEVLASKGDLTPSASAAIAANFEEHAASAQALTNDVSAEDPAAGAELTTQIGSSLAAHSAILTSLANSDQGTSSAAMDNKDGSDSLAAKVLARADTDTGASLSAEGDAVSPAQPKVATMIGFSAKVVVTDNASSSEVAAADPAQETVAAKLRARAATALARAHKVFTDTQADLDATTSAQVAAKLGEIDQLMAHASTSLSVHKYDEADADFKQVLQVSIKLSTLLAAQQKIDKNIISPVLEGHLILNNSQGGPVSLLSDGSLNL